MFRGRVYKNQRCDLGKRVADRRYSDRGQQAAEPWVGAQHPQARDSTWNLGPIREFERFEPMNVPQCVDDVGVVPVVRTTADVLDSFNGRHQRLPIQTRSSYGVKGVRHSQNAGSEWDHVAFQAGWITGTVPALMVVSDKRCNLGQRGVLRYHVRPDVRVPPHDLPLLLGQRAWFVENVVANSDLAEVVQGSSGADELAFPITQFQLLAQFSSKLGHANRVRFCVTIPSVQRLGSQIKGLILELSLALGVGYVSTNGQHETKQPRRHYVAHRERRSLEQEEKNPT